MNTGNYGWGLPVAASTFAKQLDFSLHIMHVAMGVIFVLWGIFFAYCLIRYRSRPGHRVTHPEDTRKAKVLSFVPDGVILAFEIWLIFIFGLPILAHIREDLPDVARSFRVRVVAQQFAWNIHYPGPDGAFGRTDPSLVDGANFVGLDKSDPAAADDLVSLNVFHLPMGKPVLLDLTSLDVIHSFFVPEFRVKQDAVPGMVGKVWFEPILTGQFEIGCAQLCGLGHYRMRGDVVVESPEEFEAWYKEQKAAEAAG